MEAAVIESVHSLAGMRLVHVCCEAEILDFQFDSLTLHAIGCSRIIRQGEILVTVPDYRSWDGLESTRNSGPVSLAGPAGHLGQRGSH